MAGAALMANGRADRQVWPTIDPQQQAKFDRYFKPPEQPAPERTEPLPE